MSDPALFDVAIVGAGAAGLGALAALRSQGLRAVVLEAGPRVGGRAWTTRPPALGGCPFDHGAVWLHAAERNPLVPIARRLGFPLLDAATVRKRRSLIGDRVTTGEEATAFAAAWERFERQAGEMVGPGLPDRPLADVAARRPEDPWALTVETWEGSIIAAADAGSLSLQDWQHNLLDGTDFMMESGLGAFIESGVAAEAIGDGPPVRLGTAVTAIGWNGPGGAVTLDTTAGRIEARACIVTVSTGVLAAGGIRFTPDLPPETQASIAALPMGLAIKVAMRARGADRLGIPAFTTVDRQITRSGEPAMIFNFWPFGRDHVVGWVGGETAWALNREGPAAATAFARERLRSVFGAKADAAFDETAVVVTGWGSDPLIRGAYAYARPGDAQARTHLGTPLGDGHLVIAGEACHDEGLAGTVGGAYLTGIKAAGTVARAIGHRSVQREL